jgi:parvulin-like peptidyl-prolyl isomerase
VWRPLLLFSVLGALLFGADRAFLRTPPRPEPVRISKAQLASLESEVAALGGAQSEDALASMVQAEVDDELLYRKALAAGLDRDDPVVKRRLVQNLRFAGADENRSDADLYQEALELGLDKSDPLVRRRLVQQVRMAIEAQALSPEPTEAELRAWYAANPARFEEPARTRFVQLYFAREHAAAASALLRELAAASSGPDSPDAQGEPFLHPAAQPPLSDQELALRFGAEFASALAALPTGSWQGPIPSAYGQHLVYVVERTPAGVAPFESVREPVRLGFLAERRARVLADELARMRHGVEVVVEGAAPTATE